MAAREPRLDNDNTLILPTHIETTINAIVQLQARHRRGATPFQVLFAQIIGRASRPSFLGIVSGLVLVWIVLNTALRAPPDPPPFNYLQGVITLGALVMTSLILVAQRREDELTNLREQLTLELGILSEKKAAKIIELLEELRRDLPQVRDRIDHEALAMSEPADPEAVVHAINVATDDPNTIPTMPNDT